MPFGVPWNQAIGELRVKYEEYETDKSELETVSSLKVEFGRVACGFRREDAFDEYYRTLHNVVELSRPGLCEGLYLPRPPLTGLKALEAHQTHSQ